MRFTRRAKIGLAAVGAGLLYLVTRPLRAATIPGAPSNLTVVDGKFQAVGVAASLKAGGSAVVVIADEANREMVEELAAAAARGASDVQFYFATREFAVDMAPGEIPPNLLTAWGGVGAVVNGELAVDRLWKTALDREALRADLQTAVDAVLGSLEAMDRSGSPEPTWTQLFLELA